MILDTSITVYSSVQTQDANGAIVLAFSTSLGVELANVQPYQETPYTLAQWGNVDTKSTSKLLFVNKGSNVAVGRQVLWNSQRYDIVNVHEWGNHIEAVLELEQGNG